MKKVLICIILTVFAFLSLNCTNEAVNANNVNQTNSVSQTNTIPAATPAEISQENANVKPAETPLPEFTNADTAFAEGNKLFDASENEKAVEAYKQAVKLNPDLAEAHFKLGIAYSLLEKEQAASENPDETPTPKPSKKAKKDAAPPPTKASKAFESAVKAYKKILVKNPKDDVAHFNLGRAYNKLNDDKEAEKSLSQAVKLKPDDSQYQTELGAILIKLAQYDEAVAALKKAIKLDEGNLQAEEMLEDAEAGKKRVDYGVNKLVKSKQ